jgi:anti-sigma B factor antagonist/stage II sporulation protein AA (anti-sigma F factor antagonist)
MIHMPEAKILTTRNGDVVVIKIVGVGNFQGAVVFKSIYTELIAGGAREFVIDLSECEQLDSTFLGIILGLALKLRQLGTGVVHVIHANDMIKSLFRGTGLDQIFERNDPTWPPPNDPSI